MKTPVEIFQDYAIEQGFVVVKSDNVFGEKSGRAYRDLLLSGRLPAAMRDELRAYVADQRPGDADAYYGHIELRDQYDAGKPTGGCVLVNQDWTRHLLRVDVPLCPKKVLAHRKILGVLIAAFADVELYLRDNPAEEWRPKSVACYPGFPRRINWDPKKDPSTHSWACAIDIDPSENPRGDKPCAIPEAIFAIFRAWGWICGVDWRKKFRDPMHLQWLDA